jgi:hypothetical protein
VRILEGVIRIEGVIHMVRSCDASTGSKRADGRIIMQPRCCVVIAIVCLALTALAPASAHARGAPSVRFGADCGSVQTHSVESSTRGPFGSETSNHGRVVGISKLLDSRKGYNHLTFGFQLVKSSSYNSSGGFVSAAREYFQANDDGFDQVTVSGPTFVDLRLHLGRRTIAVGRKVPKWSTPSDPGYGTLNWDFRFSLDRWSKAIRRYEKKGGKPRFGFTYRFPETKEVNQSTDPYGDMETITSTTTWSSVTCSGKSRGVKLIAKS